MFKSLACIVIICCVCYLAFLLLTSGGITGGYRAVAITDMFDIPSKVEYLDDLTDTKLTWDTKRDQYRGVASNEQIRTVSRIGSAADYGRLTQLVGKFYHKRPWEVAKLFNQSDDDIYRELREKYPRDDVDPAPRDQYHAESIWRHLRHFDIPKVPNYLDIGCNRGGITMGLSKYMGAARTYGVDVLESSHPDIEYLQASVDGQIAFKTASMDVITANMTLHHIKNLDKCIEEIVRLLKPGGILFIREHDCWSAVDAMLIDIEHQLYNRVGGDEGEYPVCHYTNYSGWDRHFAALDWVAADYFYMALKNEISPTRGFWAVYKKPVGKTKKQKQSGGRFALS